MPLLREGFDPLAQSALAHPVKALALVALLAWAVPAVVAQDLLPSAEPSSLSIAVDALRLAAEPDGGIPAARRLDRIAAAHADLRRVLSGKPPDRLDDTDARLAYTGANIASFHTASADIAREQAWALEVLEQRGLANTGDVHDTYRGLVAAREFAAAAAFAAARPEAALPPLPRILYAQADPAEASELVVQGDGAALTLQAAPIRPEITILVVAHPSCHFTQAAVRDIDRDDQLRELFATRAKWIAPQNRDINFAVIADWNRDHPDKQISIAYRAAGWPLVDDWDTPVFYFLHDGNVVSKVVGWPREGQKGDVLAALLKVQARAGRRSVGQP